jgi:(R,R)-butanediol dehydrogenase / meso-butanediol dehydrogenase / diacetyl reductase
MKKAIYHGIRDVRVESVAEPQPAVGEVKVKIKYCGICGSDLHEYLHGPFPVSSFGHEVCGEVVSVGESVAGFAPGDHVVSIFKGGYAEYMVAPQERCLRLPDDLNWQKAAVLEPLGVAAYGAERGNVQPTDTAFIAGAGPVGLMQTVAFKALGIETVYVSEISEKRRQIAQKLGATATFDPTDTKISAKIRELTNGKGVDVSVEAVGIEATLKDCLASTRFQGKVIVQGIFTERAMVHMLGFVTKEMTMIGVNNANPVRSLEWIVNQPISPEAMVTRIAPLEEISENGFERLIHNKDEEAKILIAP